MIVSNELIDIVDPVTSNNYCGNGNLLAQMDPQMAGLEAGIKKYLELLG
jgi:hypothetical protein